MRMGRPSILMISASPDTRRSTALLAQTHASLQLRTDVRVETWFLRCAWNETPWPGSRVVDDLRTWLPAATAERVGLAPVAGALRGLRLRWWLRRAAPDLIVLDDGLGARLLDHAPPHALVMVRRTAEAPVTQFHEPVLSRPPDVVLVPPGTPAEPDVRTVVEYETRDDWATARAAGSVEHRRRTRERLGLPLDVPLVSGWGDSGWLDGPDVFIRCLWAMQAHHGVQAHGVWFGSYDDVHERERLRAEAERCGLSDRFHHLPADELTTALCGDVVLLPYRDRTDDEQVLVSICAGAAVITFPVTGVTDPAVRVVAHLDVDAAAAALVEALAEDRSERWRDTLRRLDLQSLLDELVAIAAHGAARA
jgi:hypothetical protein